MHTMVTEFHQVGPLLPPPPVAAPSPEPGVPEEKHTSDHLLLQVNTFLVEHRWSPDVVHVQFVVTPLPGGDQVLHQVLVTHPAATP